MLAITRTKTQIKESERAAKKMYDALGEMGVLCKLIKPNVITDGLSGVVVYGWGEGTQALVKLAIIEVEGQKCSGGWEVRTILTPAVDGRPTIVLANLDNPNQVVAE
jgi:hypothetical protein